MQLSLAQIHLSGSGVAIAGEERYVNGTTAAASFAGGGVNKTAIPPSIGAAGGVVAFLLRASSSSSSVDGDPGRPRRTAERDYVLVFYVLMMANVFAMVPSWYRRAIKAAGAARRRGGRRRRADDDDDGEGRGGGRRREEAGLAAAHADLLRSYLPAYLLATAADWLQGPYKYALYSGYGYARRDIAHLFVAGYGSGMVLGGVIGGFADEYGRRRLCIVYCACYAASVITKHCRNFRVLLVGRMFGGIATSLLFSVFESWFICAHGERGLGRHRVIDDGDKGSAERGGGGGEEEKRRRAGGGG